jgi:hypothetical protein
VGQCFPEIIEEGGPIGLKAVRLEIAKREGETVVDAGQGWDVFGQPLNQPFGDGAACPVFAQGWGRWHFRGRVGAFGEIDAQAFQAGGRGLGAGVVDADVSGEGGHGGRGFGGAVGKYVVVNLGQPNAEDKPTKRRQSLPNNPTISGESIKAPGLLENLAKGFYPQVVVVDGVAGLQ